MVNSTKVKPSSSLFKNQNDLKVALDDIFEIVSNKSNNIPKDNEGYLPIKFLYESVKNKNPKLSYINRNHIIEFFFKDLAREIRFKGENQIKYDFFKKPSENEILTEGEPLATLFHNPTDLSAALITSVHILKNQDPNIEWDSNNFCNISDLCRLLKNKMPFLSYINRNHIIELFFKDKQHKIMFSGPDLIKYKVRRIVEPPETLYFGTLLNLARKMKDKGIFSNTKRYIKLYSSSEKAKQFASKFITQVRDQATALKIDAKKAYQSGIKFSSYEKDEFIVSNIDKEFIIWEKNLEE